MSTTSFDSVVVCRRSPIMSPTSTSPSSSCPFQVRQKVVVVPENHHRWWPNRLSVSKLSRHSNQHENPTDSSMPKVLWREYAKEFSNLNWHELKSDIGNCLITSSPLWPFASHDDDPHQLSQQQVQFHYGPLMIRLAWHSAGSYRITDGRGGSNSGNIRFAPLNSWPDNANLDKAKRLLWPIKQKYGQKLSCKYSLQVLVSVKALYMYNLINLHCL
jgi:catalase-peroxidase